MLLDHFGDQVFYSHSMQKQTVTLFEDFNAESPAPDLMTAFADNAAIHAGLTANAESGDEVILLTGIRDPIVRSLSVAMQMLDTLFKNCRGGTNEETALRLAERIAKLWTVDDEPKDAADRLARAIIRAPFNWFADEIEQPFGFDLLAEPFDMKRGYQVLTNGHVRLLLFRMENSPHAIEAGLESLFPGHNFTLPRANVAADKPDSAIYTHLQQCFRLPAAVLETIYHAPHVRAFFSEEEIAAAKARWTERAPKEHRVATGHRETVAGCRFRATVAMPVLNNAAWVGGQLNSLFAQWRSDVDLIVIDDGSTDGSFEVVRKALAAQPNAVATLLRNDRPQGLGVISQILRHTDSKVIIQADSDDISLPGRLDAIIERFEIDPQCKLVTSNGLKISAEGVPLGIIDVHLDDGVFREAVEAAGKPGDSRWIGATSAFHRSLLEDFPLDPDVCPYGLDLLLALRATLTGTHHYLAEPLIGWRQHANNTHRLAGFYSVDDPMQERYQSLELMAQAQRIRDIRRAQAMSPAPDALDAVMDRAQQLFHDRFTAWSRVRNRIKGPEHVSATSVPLSLSVKVPPIVSLSPGWARAFGQSDPLGTMAAEWDGFYAAEKDRNWTARRALLAIRAPGATHLILRLAGLSFTGPQRVRVRAGEGSWVEIEVTGRQTEVIVPVVSQDEVFALQIDAPGAARRSDHIPDYRDSRQLGVHLFSIEAV